MKQLLITAVNHALKEQWDEAHQIVQVMDKKEAYWIHAILHRIEGDNSNAKYWYKQAGVPFTDENPQDELEKIKTLLNDPE